MLRGIRQTKLKKAKLAYGILCIILLLAGAKTYGIHALTSMQAWTAGTSGALSAYAQEYDQMTRMILTSTDTDVICPGITNTPEIFEPLEFDTNPNGWVNTAMARYYGKQTIRRWE